MGKIAFVFSGQGAQFPGMGQQLAAGSKAAAEVFTAADRVRPGTSALCFSGTPEELAVTANTQPCVFAVDLAYAKALAEKGIVPDMAAGFSLGEVAALAFAGAFSEEDGFRLINERARLMQAAAEAHSASMAAVVKLDNPTVEEICSRFKQVYPVNYNCPEQLTVAGATEEIPLLAEAVKAAGGRAIPLAVGGGFHSPFMAPAMAGFTAALTQVDIQPLRVPVYANLTGQPYKDVKTQLAAQMINPVRWQAAVEAMITDGADTFIEVGPGKVLCGLIGKINPKVNTMHADDLL